MCPGLSLRSGRPPSTPLRLNRLRLAANRFSALTLSQLLQRLLGADMGISGSRLLARERPDARSVFPYFFPLGIFNGFLDFTANALKLLKFIHRKPYFTAFFSTYTTPLLTQEPSRTPE